MPKVELRVQAGVRSPGDLVLTVQDKTYDYLMSSPAPEIRVSTYVDEDIPQVEEMYAELFLKDECEFESKVTKLIPGSKTRGKITLPAAMEEGEQLTVLVTRTKKTT